MALTNSQYDTIMRGYDRRQYENYRRQCARTDEIYEKFPRIREIQEAMSACSIRQAERLFDEEPDALEILRQELSSLRAEKEHLDINTLGVLYVVEAGESIQSVEDLKGKTIYSTGKGTTPEFALNYILRENGIDPETDVTIEYKSEATEVAAALAETDDAIAVLPQPFVTTAMMQNDKLRIALSLTDEWNKLDNGSTLVTGVTIIRTDVLEENPAAVEKFLEEYEASINYTETNAEDAAKLIAQYEIVPKEPIALKALPGCNIHFIKGEEMKEKASGYLQVLFDADPKSVGGTLPDDAFYYTE